MHYMPCITVFTVIGRSTFSIRQTLPITRTINATPGAAPLVVVAAATSLTRGTSCAVVGGAAAGGCSGMAT